MMRAMCAVLSPISQKFAKNRIKKFHPSPPVGCYFTDGRGALFIPGSISVGPVWDPTIFFLRATPATVTRQLLNTQMMKRPVSPPSELPTSSMAPSSSGSRFASLRQAMNGRSNSASARTICLLLGALCLVFFLAEMNENNSVATPASSNSSAGPAAGGNVATSDGSGGGGGEAELDVTNGDRHAAKVAPESLPGGLRRFGSFAEYVVSAA